MRPFLYLLSIFLLLCACAQRNVTTSPVPAASKAPEAAAPVATPQTQQAPIAALLLPLSGTNALLGQNLLQAAQLALFENPASNIQLIPIDSNISIQNAIAQASTRGAGTIIGPVFGQEAKSLAPGAQAARLKMLALTNDRSAAAPGVYVLGVTPESQIARVVDFALSQGIKTYAALLPDNAFGHIALTTLQTKMQQASGQLITGIFYPSNALDYTPYVQQLVDLHKTQMFQALLLPEGGSKGKSLASLTRTLGLREDQVRLLGSSLWLESAADPAFNGGWFPVTPPERWRDFRMKYQQSFGQAPDPRGLLVYDSVSLLATINEQHPSAKDLENLDGFAGSSGLFRLNADGTIDRRLTILEAQPTGPILKDAAPNSFTSALN